MTYVTVATIAKSEEELDELQEDLNNQTDKAFEFIYSTKDSIPEAWQEVVDKAFGEYILITESDVRVPEDWVERMKELVSQDDRDFVMGHEVRLPDAVQSMSNVAIKSEIARAIPFRDRFDITEDTKWFAELQEMVDVEKYEEAPVVFHDKGQPEPWRHFRHGIHRAEIWLEHDYEGKTAAGVTFKRINRILCELSTLIGQTIGLLKHPVKLYKKVMR